MEAGSNVATFMRDVNSLLNSLAEFEARPDEGVVVAQILSALPESFDSIINVISGEKTLPSLTELTGRLPQEEDRRKTRDGPDEVEALMVRLRRAINTRRDRTPGTEWRTSLHCNRCRIQGHFMRDCKVDLTKLRRSGIPARSSTGGSYSSTGGSYSSAPRSDDKAYSIEESMKHNTTAGGQAHPIKGTGNVMLRVENGEIKRGKKRSKKWSLSDILCETCAKIRYGTQHHSTHRDRPSQPLAQKAGPLKL
ncbi:hypothetical protein R1sor_021329 [Riccia sorocarpa]|uniref:CCHC-type domain-containing protein n=1 Tax=Riccia sorocarpa TaxID=122646 RepID=A0ABD3GGS1_9MARC